MEEEKDLDGFVYGNGEATRNPEDFEKRGDINEF